MSDALPFNIEDLTGAAARVLLAPLSAALPVTPSSIYGQKKPYTAVSPWWNVGATAGPLQVGRNITVAGYNIEQNQGAVLEEPTEVIYTVQVPFAEFNPQTLQVIMESPAAETVGPATAAQGAGSKMPFGNVYELTHYRIAFVVRRTKKQGEVVEGAAGLVRGRYLTYVGYDCTVQGENVSTSFGKGQLSQAAITFKLFPDSAVTDEGEEHGFFFDEDAQTIPAA